MLNFIVTGAKVANSSDFSKFYPLFSRLFLVFPIYLPTFAYTLSIYTMADNFLERQYAAYEERKKNLGKPQKKSSVKFYTRPGKPKEE